MPRFHHNKVANIILNGVVLGLGTLAWGGIAMMIFAMVTGQVQFDNISWGIYG